MSDKNKLNIGELDLIMYLLSDEIDRREERLKATNDSGMRDLRVDLLERYENALDKVSEMHKELGGDGWEG